MSDFNEEGLTNEGNSQENIQGPAKVEKISLTEISEEIEKQKDEKTQELVNRIMNKISELD